MTRWSTSFVALVAALLGACAAPSLRPAPPPPSPPPSPPSQAATSAEEPFGAPMSLALDKGRLRADGMSPSALGKLEASAYRYSRLLADEMAARSCWAFRDDRWHLPMLPVHGDAHVEQLVVTGAAYGLEDFDRAGFGPAVVDLVRYATSLRLACREVGFACDPDRAVDAFLVAYRAALDVRPVAPPAEPTWVARIRARSPQERGTWLAWATSLVEASRDDLSGRARWSDFVALMSEVQPDVDPRTFEVQSWGPLRMGVGSALEAKTLIRIRGATDDPLDDVILEGRTSGMPTRGGCVWRPGHGPSSVLLFTALIGRRMPEIYGYLPLHGALEGRVAWIQSWDPGYRELSIRELTSQDELDEIARDAGTQLGGHYWGAFPALLQAHQRHEQLWAFDHVRDRVPGVAKELADETVAAWRAFRAIP